MSKHIYYRVLLTLESPMSIGSGSADSSDSDIVRDSHGNPHIPGTSLAGIYRSLFDIKDQKKYFGYVEINKKTGKQDTSKPTEAEQSPLLVYDGVLVSRDPHISIRDCVKLDDNKVAEPGSKFDFEMIEPGAVFKTYIEADKNSPTEMPEVIENILSALDQGNIMLGQKTSRGYGRVSVRYQKKEFSLPEQRNEWLDFKMFDDAYWQEANKRPDCRHSFPDILPLVSIRIPLKQAGALSIRQYSSDAALKGQSVPDYTQLTLSGGLPVIPGTSWAGAFRHRMKTMLEQVKPEAGTDELTELFGTVGENGLAQKSKIIFSESQLKNGFSKELTRNSIDRFSAGTKEGALYTERTYYNGNLYLEIRIHKEILADRRYRLTRQLLMACIADLHHGLLSVGGLTAVGRGIFRIIGGEIEIDNNKINISDLERGLLYECEP